MAESALTERAQRTLGDMAPQLGQVARVMPLMLSNIALWRSGSPQVVLCAGQGTDDLAALEAVVAGHYVPGLIQIPRPAGAADSSLPWLAAMTARDGRATAYVCKDFACQAPVTDAAALEAQLHGSGGHRLVTLS